MTNDARGAGATAYPEFDLKAYLSARRDRINKATARLFKPAYPESRLVAAMQYSLEAGGKRIRPILCMAAAEAVGGNPESTLPACCAIEMIHTYSLIHDDLPAMDNDDLRRGKPTCHIAFGESNAILAGDGLLTLAFQILSRPDNWQPSGDSRPWLKVIRVLSTAAGPDGMIEGQLRDIAAQEHSVDIETLKGLHELKTGAIIRASVAAGAILGGASETQLKHLDNYARKIGLAFQVADDILDLEGDPGLMGKSRGSDVRLSKSTYPKLMGIEASKDFARELIDDSLKALDFFDTRSEPLRAIARYVIDRKR